MIFQLWKLQYVFLNIKIIPYFHFVIIDWYWWGITVIPLNANYIIVIIDIYIHAVYTVLTAVSSSSHKSNREFKAFKCSSGKCLKNRGMNDAANFFSPVVPFTPFRMLWYSSTNFNITKYKQSTSGQEYQAEPLSQSLKRNKKDFSTFPPSQKPPVL